MIFYYLIGTMFIFLLTSLGSLLVVFSKNITNSNKTEIFLSFAGGIMLSAALFSLILPALENDGIYEKYNLLMVIFGIVLGSLFILIFDAFLLKVKKNNKDLKYKKLFFAMTIHNIPEGLAVGLAFGIALISKENLDYIVPLTLALGIGIQNFPEGASTSYAMLDLTKSKKKSTMLGILSGSVEPVASLFGFVFAIYLKDFLPLILSIGGGAMLFVVIDEIFVNKEETNSLKNNIAFLFGFLIMMVLDVMLG